MNSSDGYKYMTNGKNIDLCPVLTSEKNIDNHLNIIKMNLLDKEDTIKNLRQLLKEAKDEAYASKEMSEMKIKFKKMEADYNRGFPITEVEIKQINNWQHKHNKTMHDDVDSSNLGTIGGRYIYEFFPVSIGVFGTCICTVCRSRAHRAAATANTQMQKEYGYDEETYINYMKQHNAEFDFGEMTF